jgi:hypothetical protein
MNMRAIEHNLRQGLALPLEEREKYITGAKEILEESILKTCKSSMPDKYVFLSYLLAQVIELN